MKKLLSVCSIAVLGLTATNAIAAPSYIQRDANGGYNVTYDYTDKAKSGWYVGGHVGLSLLNFTNDYSYTDGAADDSDEYSFEPVFSGDISAGFRFNYFWRAELELGYIGEFEDSNALATFKLSAPYALVNGYYDFNNGIYVGAGVGAALLNTVYEGTMFPGSNGREETSVTPMANLMLGYSYELDHNLVLDLRYRLAGIVGHEHERTYIGGYKFTSDTGVILENSFSLGLRYEF